MKGALEPPTTPRHRWLEAIETHSVRAVSVTGQSCALQCAHCGGAALRGMTDLKAALTAQPGDFLVSGGSDQRGRVPLLAHASRIRSLPGRRNLHPGLPDEETIRVLPSLGEVASLDFVLDGRTIREAFGLDVPAGAYLQAFRALSAVMPVVPHVTIGLWRGRIRGEEEALAALADEGAEAVVLLVYRPLRGARWENVRPPEPGEVARVLTRAREILPRARLTLGCFRPGGRYRVELDRLAIETGVDAIVNPSPLAVSSIADLRVRRRDECCAFASHSGFDRDASGTRDGIGDAGTKHRLSPFG